MCQIDLMGVWTAVRHTAVGFTWCIILHGGHIACKKILTAEVLVGALYDMSNLCTVNPWSTIYYTGLLISYFLKKFVPLFENQTLCLVPEFRLLRSTYSCSINIASTLSTLRVQRYCNFHDSIMHSCSCWLLGWVFSWWKILGKNFCEENLTI